MLSLCSFVFELSSFTFCIFRICTSKLGNRLHVQLPDRETVAKLYDPAKHQGIGHDVLQKRAHSKSYHNTKRFYNVRFPDKDDKLVKELSQAAGVKTVQKWRELFQM